MKHGTYLSSYFFADIVIFIFFFICAAGSPAEEKVNPVKPANTPTKTQDVAPGSYPDLALEKIELDKECRLILTIRNNGPGPVPKEKFNRCSVKIRAGRKQETFYLGAFSITGKPPVDPNRILLKAGGRISYNTGIGILKETKVTVNVDSENAIMETNEGNNRSGTVVLKPDCPRAGFGKLDKEISGNLAN